MLTFEYHRPADLRDACRLLARMAEGGTLAKAIAGGTDLLVQIRDRDSRLSGLRDLVDLSHLPELSYIREEGGYVAIGGGTPYADIQESALLRGCAPLLCEAARSVGSPQIRAVGTLGGAVANASPSSDPVTALVALEAEIKLTSVSGTRVLPLAEVITGSGQTLLAPDEIITQVRFGRPGPETRSAFIKLGRRKALAISRMNVAVLARMEGERVAELRISPGCIFAAPTRVTAAENLLTGKTPTPDLIRLAGEAVSAEMVEKTGVRWSTAYKKPVIEALVCRALRTAFGLPEEE